MRLPRAAGELAPGTPGTPGANQRELRQLRQEINRLRAQMQSRYVRDVTQDTTNPAKLTWHYSDDTTQTHDMALPGTGQPHDGITLRSHSPTAYFSDTGSGMVLDLGGERGQITLLNYRPPNQDPDGDLMPLRDFTTDAIWTSSNTSVATVDAAGRVTPVGVGTCTVNAYYSSGNYIANVTVRAADEVTVRGYGDGIDGMPGETFDLVVDVHFPAFNMLGWSFNPVAAQTVSFGPHSTVPQYSSENEAIATVDRIGRVKLVGNGYSQINVSYGPAVGSVTVHSRLPVGSGSGGGGMPPEAPDLYSGASAIWDEAAATLQVAFPFVGAATSYEIQVDGAVWANADESNVNDGGYVVVVGDWPADGGTHHAVRARASNSYGSSPLSVRIYFDSVTSGGGGGGGDLTVPDAPVLLTAAWDSGILTVTLDSPNPALLYIVHLDGDIAGHLDNPAYTFEYWPPDPGTATHAVTLSARAVGPDDEYGDPTYSLPSAESNELTFEATGEAVPAIPVLDSVTFYQGTPSYLGYLQATIEPATGAAYYQLRVSYGDSYSDTAGIPPEGNSPEVLGGLDSAFQLYLGDYPSGATLSVAAVAANHNGDNAGPSNAIDVVLP